MTFYSLVNKRGQCHRLSRELFLKFGEAKHFKCGTLITIDGY